MNIERVSFNYGKKSLFNELSAVFASEKKITTIVGPNGAGKTSLFKLMYGLLRPHSGEIHSQYSRMRFLPSSDFFIPYLTPMENFQLIWNESREKTERKLKLQDRIAAFNSLFDIDLFNELNLNEVLSSEFKTLSTGEKKKVQLVGTLLVGGESPYPDLLLLDEPNNGVDIFSNLVLDSLIEKMKSIGIKIILSTHVLESIPKFDTELFFLRDGSFAEHYAEVGKVDLLKVVQQVYQKT